MEIDNSVALAAFARATEDDVGRLLMAASRAVNASVLDLIDPTGSSGVRLAHVPLIAVLDPRGSRFKDLAIKLGITRQAVAALVKDLVAAGIVYVEEDANDKRAARVVLSDAGARFCVSATTALQQQGNHAAAQLSAQELADLKRLLNALVGAGEQHGS